jgi:hypothetical protein
MSPDINGSEKDSPMFDLIIETDMKALGVVQNQELTLR